MISSRKVPPVTRLIRIALNGSRHRFLIAAGLILSLALGAGATVKLAGSAKQAGSRASLPTIPPASYSHVVTPAGAAFFDISATPVTTVSAAAFEQVPVAPDSIVAAFGTQLASSVIIGGDADPNTPGVQLPTDLGGTSVEVNGRKAGLFFVSPGQINYLIPSATESGTANVVVKFGQTISNGQVMIAKVAPAIFTANSNGRGVPAAVILRVKPDGSQRTESLSQYSQLAQKYITKPIDIPAGDLAVLVLFLSGIRNAADTNGDGNLNESIRVLIGGVEAPVLYANRQPDFVGLDQVNVVIPASLVGRGIVNVSVSGTGFGSSNIADIEIAGNGGAQPPVISGFGSTALAGQELIIDGQGFSAVKEENFVRINGLDVPSVIEATTTRLKVMVPFNVESGTVSVRTPQGEGQSISTLQVRTSISGFVENTNGVPLSNVAIKVSGLPITATTNSTGAFVLPDVTAGPQFVEIDGTSLQTSPPYPKVTLKITALSNRDNQFSRSISLQQETGGSGVIGGGSFSEGQTAGESLQAQPSPLPFTIETGDYQVVVPPGTKVSGPKGETSVRLTLTPLRNARVPVELPLGYFSTDIVQLTPFDYQFEPGIQLIFPNTEGFPANTSLLLFHLDKDSGKFIEEKGVAKVSADGKRIETDANAIKVSTYYFATLFSPTTTVTGRVVNEQGKPVSKAIVRCKGQVATTDGNGSYVLRYVPAKEGEVLTVEAGALLASQNVLKALNVSAAAVIGGITKMADLILPDETKNRPPNVDAPEKAEVAEGKTLDLVITIKDPDVGQTITATSVSGASFATLAKRTLGINPNTYNLSFAPTSGQAGTYTIIISATDSLGAVGTARMTVVVSGVNRVPTATPASLTLDEDTMVAIKLAGTDPDTNDRLTFKIASQPANGVLSGTPPELTYKPNLNFNGTDRFTFVANDGKADSPAATVTLVVTPINDAPVLTVPTAQTVNEGQLLSFTVSAADPDAGQIVAITATGLPEGATFTSATQVGSMQFRWTPSFTQSGTYTVSFKATDNATPALSDTKEVKIMVNDVSTLTVPPAQTVNELQQLVFDVSANPGTTGPVTITVSGVPAGASVGSPAINNTQFKWTPDITQAGTYTVFFQATINAPSPITETKSVQITVADTVRDLNKEGSQFTILGAAGTPANQTSDVGDMLGNSVATGDLNGDGVPDVIVGAPMANGAAQNSGKVYVFFGRANLTGQVDLADKKADVEISGEAADDHFGTSLAVGDINGDGKKDLIVGTPQANVGDFPDAGKVYVFFGNFAANTSETAGKLAGATILGSQRSLMLGATVASAAVFPKSNAAEDLVIGAPGYDTPGNLPLIDAGALIVFYGKSDFSKTIDLAATTPNFMVTGQAASWELGKTLAVGNFIGDGWADIAVGAPLSNANGVKGSGNVYVLTGASSLEGVRSVTQSASLILFGTGENDNLGSKLAMGDLNGDGRSDLIIGASGADASPGRQDVGAVYVFFGGPSVQARNVDLIILGAGATQDKFPDALGSSLAVGDFNGDGVEDLAIGAPGADISDSSRNPLGAVYVVFGSKSGQIGTRGIFDLASKQADYMVVGADSGDKLGAGGIAIANFNASEPSDLILGIPQGRSLNNSRIDAGELRVIYGVKR